MQEVGAVGGFRGWMQEVDAGGGCRGWMQGGGCRGWMQDVDAGGGCRRWMQGVDAGECMQGVYRWIPPGWLRISFTVGGKSDRKMILLENVWKCFNYFGGAPKRRIINPCTCKCRVRAGAGVVGV